MYTISKDKSGVVLICHDCPHTERVNGFSETLGSRRTQAARAMQNHSQDKHVAGSVLTAIPNKPAVTTQL